MYQKGYRILNGLLLFIAIASLIQAIINISLHPDRFQNDIHTYYYSPIGWQQGQNPYRELFFIYPPMILKAFSIFSHLMGFASFYQFFLFCHVVVVILWILLSRELFLPELSLGFYVLFSWVIGNATIYRDLHAGNITTYESLILLAAFWFLLRERLYAFVMAVMMAASFKLTPLLFLLLLPLSSSVKKFKALELAGLIILALIGLNLWISPELSKDFLLQATYRVEEHHGFVEHGFFAPSVLAFLRQYTSSLSTLLPWIGYFIFNFIIVVVSGMKLFRNSLPIQKKSILYFILTYLLFLPRLKNYNLVLAVPSIIYFLYFAWKKKCPARWITVICAILITINITEYHVLFGLIGVFVIATINFSSHKPQPTPLH